MGHNRRSFHRIFSSDALWEYHAVKLTILRSFLVLFFVVSAIASKTDAIPLEKNPMKRRNLTYLQLRKVSRKAHFIRVLS